MSIYKKHKSYNGFTLVEMLMVMAIIIVIFGAGFSALSGLQRTTKMNEYTATFEQTVMDVQRAAMLLSRGSDENWMYGLGIDLSSMIDETSGNSDGTIKTFKWCSAFPEYGDSSTRGKIPNFTKNVGACTGSSPNGSSCLPTGNKSYNLSTCSGVVNTSKLVLLTGYESGLTTPKSYIKVIANTGCAIKNTRYVVFESVSGKAFFYDGSGNILNHKFSNSGQTAEIEIPSGCPADLKIQITPTSSGGSSSTRCITISHLGGKVTSIVDSDGDCSN